MEQNQWPVNNTLRAARKKLRAMGHLTFDLEDLK